LNDPVDNSVDNIFEYIKFYSFIFKRGFFVFDKNKIMLNK